MENPQPRTENKEKRGEDLQRKARPRLPLWRGHAQIKHPESPWTVYGKIKEATKTMTDPGAADFVHTKRSVLPMMRPGIR